MSQPVIFAIDGDARVTAALREDLDRRFGEDFRVIGESPGQDPCHGTLAPFISKSAFTISWRSCGQMPNL